MTNEQNPTGGAPRRRRRNKRTTARVLPLDAAARTQERLRLVGPDACCHFCGIKEPRLLEHPNSRLLHKHHVLGRHHDLHTTDWLCPNCHRSLHIALQDAGVDLEPQSSLLETIAAILRGLGVYFEHLAAALIRFANRLTNGIGALDAKLPEWRDAMGGAA